MGYPEKPTVGINSGHDTGKSNVSSRGMWCQLEKGVDLTVAMRESAAAVGGEGGGHKIASGATIPAGQEMNFLSYLDKFVGEQKLNHAN